MKYSVAFTQQLNRELLDFLNQSSSQEHACFCLWNPSSGKNRYTALLHEIIFPNDGELILKGDVAITDDYFLRALSLANKKGMGLALLHSHPDKGWQKMSKNDKKSERGLSRAVKGVTGLSLVGLTVSSDEVWSSRHWIRIARRRYEERWCEAVRIIGSKFDIYFNNQLRPIPKLNRSQMRTISAWGEVIQSELGRLRVGVVGVGSVGSIISESLARMGIGELRIIDFDVIEEVNLDRQLNATLKDAKSGTPKVIVLERKLPKNATANGFKIKGLQYSIVEEEGFRNALDCDILFSCVDRPWPRSVLNFIAYAHLIPVIDGGILLKVNSNGRLKKGSVGAQLAVPGRQCLECSGQYDSGLVSIERGGYLDDPSYIEGLPWDDDLRRSENVFAFSLLAASLEIQQLISMIVKPVGENIIHKQVYSVVAGVLDQINEGCSENCLFPKLVALGDSYKNTVTDIHPLAEKKRNAQ